MRRSDRFVVRYELIDNLDHSHTQVWSDEQLVSWELGAVPSDPHIVVSRRDSIDRGDLCRTLPPCLVAHETSFLIGSRHVDLLGSLGAIPKEMDGWLIASAPNVRLSIPDSPVGLVEVTLRWRDGHIAVDWLDRSPVRLTVDLPYVDALDWLWSDLILANLHTRGLRFGATDVFVLSEIEGIVSARDPRPVDPAILQRLKRYRAVRRSPISEARGRPGEFGRR